MLMSFATIFSYCVCAAVSLKVLDFQRISDDVEKDIISTATADSGILLPSSFVEYSRLVISMIAQDEVK